MIQICKQIRQIGFQTAVSTSDSSMSIMPFPGLRILRFPLQKISPFFHDPIIVTAILDRLLHHSIVLNIRGKSFRLKEITEKEIVNMNGKRA